MDVETADAAATEAERLYREHGRRLWWALLGYAGDSEIASDPWPRPFAQLLRRGDAVRAPANWVWRAAFRFAAGELRRRLEVQPLGLEASYEMDEPSEVIAALRRLSPRQRAAVLLHHYAGYSIKEIASILGSSPATVGVHLTRGRRRLREILGEARSRQTAHQRHAPCRSGSDRIGVRDDVGIGGKRHPSRGRERYPYARRHRRRMSWHRLGGHRPTGGVMRRGLVALLLLAAACAAREAPRPGDAGEEPSEPAVFASCGGVRFPDLPPDTSSFVPFASWSEVNLANLGGEAPFFEEFIDPYTWFLTDQSASERVLFGEPSAPGASDPPYAYAALEQRDGQWAPTGWGQCRIELEADGWGNARFRLDPTVRPDPQSRTVSVLATEVACAGGRPPQGREVRSVVLDETDEVASIVILVEPPTGGQTCPGNPSFEFQVDLGSPLGDRTILDASVYPPLEREWSPTEGSD